jgi:hypothetical protein
MKAYFGFDDTDTIDSLYGTGKLVRRFQTVMPDGCECIGVLRQQLLVCEQILYTSHNSAACLIMEIPERDVLDTAIERAVTYLERHAIEGSDPGLCVAAEWGASMNHLIDFGYGCTRRIMTQKQALLAAEKFHISGHGGTNDGIIGAAAAVGLTVSGWAGRFIEFGNLRRYPNEISVSELEQAGIQVVAIERDARVPAPGDQILTKNWIRPRLLGHQPVLLVTPAGEDQWVNIHGKRKKGNHYHGSRGLSSNPVL